MLARVQGDQRIPEQAKGGAPGSLNKAQEHHDIPASKVGAVTDVLKVADEDLKFDSIDVMSSEKWATTKGPKKKEIGRKCLELVHFNKFCLLPPDEMDENDEENDESPIDEYEHEVFMKGKCKKIRKTKKNGRTRSKQMRKTMKTSKAHKESEERNQIIMRCSSCFYSHFPYQKFCRRFEARHEKISTTNQK